MVTEVKDKFEYFHRVWFRSYPSSFLEVDRIQKKRKLTGALFICRSNAASRIPGGDTNSLDGCDRDKGQLRPHQVHPVLDSQALLCYEKPPLGERPSTPPPPQSCYPLAPNICVEAGRIQFIRQDTDGAAQQPSPAPPPDPLAGTGRVTVTRGLQTEFEEDVDFREIQVGGGTRYGVARYACVDRSVATSIAWGAVQKFPRFLNNGLDIT
ncbi:hypothetical protein NQ318_010459 [Aromia moschata]|uniref:Uncharacterized protein n=1 Tax=Aromia moschata TaxID=1265417 RepID=A0AAV8YAW0_9CUCU|nr:hypothetical protein NQ318_010459 [Aromia moschata]